MLNNKREVIKPWGKEIIWAETTDYVGKLLHITEGHKLSILKILKDEISLNRTKYQ